MSMSLTWFNLSAPQLFITYPRFAKVPEDLVEKVGKKRMLTWGRFGTIRPWNFWVREGIGWGFGLLQVRGRHLFYIGDGSAGPAFNFLFFRLLADPSRNAA